ncbi:RNA-binding protein [Histomonas meleagridis]|uniref:RNA-binding protein n=1 Tax=Histomonas meleagridis TaxID=135588 RepID=UPI00355A6ECD|nr:RNA-binding protein [Histomonas meleagridis]KAH0796438.1 RNA-binding protein [Histomonas meleagridis]
MESNWSDFVSTPPNFSGSPSERPFIEYFDSYLQPPPYPLISEEKSAKIFETPINTATQQTSVSSTLYPPSLQYPSSYSSYNDFYEIENRTLIVSNVNPHTSHAEFENTFFVKNGIKSINFSKLSKGIVTIEYYDLRSSIQFKKMKNGSMLHGNVIMVVYAPLPKIEDPKKPPNNGTIVVFNLPSGINDQHIESSFSQFGEIRQIRGTPTKPSQRFIEYFDTRSSEAALNGLNGKYVMGSRVSIEFSLPGGFRRNAQKFEPFVRNAFQK